MLSASGTMFTSIITQRIIAPFAILEGICLLIISIAAFLLAIPFVPRIDLLSGFYKNLKAILQGIKQTETPSTTSYPSLPAPLPSETPELSVLHLPIYPTPVNGSSEELIVGEIVGNCIPGLIKEIAGNIGAKINPRSDEYTLVNYNSYRHKLIEETLQREYGGGYAPGNVILNLIQLNTPDSSASVILSKKYDRSFFENINILDTVQVALCKSNSSPDQLAHFIPKNLCKPSTTDTQTETAEVSEISIVTKPSGTPTTRPNTPTNCQRIISKRSHEAAAGSLVNYSQKSPFPTPVNSQASLNAHRSLSQRMRDQRFDSTGRTAVTLLQNIVHLRKEAPLTEQLYRRNDTRPDVVSRTHVEAEEYLNRIARNRRYDVTVGQTVQEPRIRSSLKKSCRQQIDRGKKLSSVNHGDIFNNGKTEGSKVRRSVRDELKRLSTSKPTIWNN